MKQRGMNTWKDNNFEFVSERKCDDKITGYSFSFCRSSAQVQLQRIAEFIALVLT